MPSLVELAELCKAVYHDQASVTFAHDVRQQQTKTCQRGDKTSTWTRKGAAWSNFNFHAALDTNVAGDNLLCRHGIQTCVEAIRSRPEGYHPVDL